MAPLIVLGGKEPKGGTTNWGRKLVNDLKDECISRKIMTTKETLRSYHMAARMSCWEMNLYYEEKGGKWMVLPEYLEIAEMGWHAQRNEDVVKQAQKIGLEDLSGTRSALINCMLRDKRDKILKEKLWRATERANETREKDKRAKLEKEKQEKEGGNGQQLEASPLPALSELNRKAKPSPSSQDYNFNHSFRRAFPSSLGFSLESSIKPTRRPSTTSTASTSTLTGENFH